MTIKTLLKNASQVDPLDAQILLAHVLQKPREFLITHEDSPVPFLKQIKFKHLINKRKNGTPFAYLTGHKEFFGLDFLVNKYTLIPRPDTEVLVELAVSNNKQQTTNNNSPIFLLDIGTGSGCIPISIMKTIEQENKKTTKQIALETYATDISQPALKVAQKNATEHNTPITLLHGNLLEPFIKTCKLANLQTCQLIITANLPYLTEHQFKEEPSIQHEPKSALVANNNGLALYEELLNQLKEWLSSDTCYVIRVTCYFEIDPDQTTPITKLIQTYFPKTSVTIKKDLSGFNRVVYFSLN